MSLATGTTLRSFMQAALPRIWFYGTSEVLVPDEGDVQGVTSARPSQRFAPVPRTPSRSKLLQSLLVTESILKPNQLQTPPPCQSVTLTFPDLTTSWRRELIDSDVLADLDFLTGAMMSVR